MARKVLFLIHHAPQAGVAARERLDQVLMALAFDLEVRVVFVGDGVLQLLKEQDTPGERNFAVGYRSLELYGVAGVHVESESLTERGLGTSDLLLEVEPLARSSVQALLAEQDLLA